MADHLYTFEYDRGFLPPFPTMEIELKPLHRDADGARLVALVDSGSDGTMVPVSILRQIKARRIGRIYIESITGIRQPGDVYEVWLDVVGRPIGRVEVVGDIHNKQMILGRDVLNQFVITLNGLANVVEVVL